MFIRMLRSTNMCGYATRNERTFVEFVGGLWKVFSAVEGRYLRDEVAGLMLFACRRIITILVGDQTI